MLTTRRACRVDNVAFGFRYPPYKVRLSVTFLPFSPAANAPPPSLAELQETHQGDLRRPPAPSGPGPGRDSGGGEEVGVLGPVRARGRGVGRADAGARAAEGVGVGVGGEWG